MNLRTKTVLIFSIALYADRYLYHDKSSGRNQVVAEIIESYSQS